LAYGNSPNIENSDYFSSLKKKYQGKMEGHNDTLEKINGEREAKRKYLQEFVKRM
jgi:hypothetical protein